MRGGMSVLLLEGAPTLTTNTNATTNAPQEILAGSVRADDEDERTQFAMAAPGAGGVGRSNNRTTTNTSERLVGR